MVLWVSSQDCQERPQILSELSQNWESGWQATHQPKLQAADGVLSTPDNVLDYSCEEQSQLLGGTCPGWQGGKNETLVHAFVLPIKFIDSQ